MLTTDQKGTLAEQAIVLEALKFGAGVFQPLGDERYDLILDLRPKLLRVQCKWAVFRQGVVFVPTRRCRRGPDGFIHRGYELGEIDTIAAYCADLDRCYLLPLDMSVGRALVQLRVDPAKNNQSLRVNWARDFEFGATLTKLQGPIAQLGERRDGIAKAAGSSPAGSTHGAA